MPSSSSSTTNFLSSKFSRIAASVGPLLDPSSDRLRRDLSSSAAAFISFPFLSGSSLHCPRASYATQRLVVLAAPRSPFASTLNPAACSRLSLWLTDSVAPACVSDRLPRCSHASYVRQHRSQRLSSVRQSHRPEAPCADRPSSCVFFSRPVKEVRAPPPQPLPT